MPLRRTALRRVSICPISVERRWQRAAMAMVISRQKAAQQGTRSSTRQDAASTQQAINVKVSREFRLNRPLKMLPSPSSIRWLPSSPDTSMAST